MQRLQELKSELPPAGSGCRFTANSWEDYADGHPLVRHGHHPSPPWRRDLHPSPRPLLALQWTLCEALLPFLSRRHDALDSLCLLGQLARQTLPPSSGAGERSHPRTKTARPASVSPENYLWNCVGFRLA